MRTSVSKVMVGVIAVALVCAGCAGQIDSRQATYSGGGRYMTSSSFDSGSGKSFSGDSYYVPPGMSAPRMPTFISPEKKGEGAEINPKNSGLTALILAAEKGYTEIVKLLKKAGAKE